MIERRRTPRRRVCFGGLVQTAAFLPGIACSLRDVSLSGARIRLPVDADLPERFDLLVPCRGETRRSRVVWRAGETAGLGFEDAASDIAAGDVGSAVLLGRLAASEAEVVRLRAILGSAAATRSDLLH